MQPPPIFHAIFQDFLVWAFSAKEIEHVGRARASYVVLPTVGCDSIGVDENASKTRRCKCIYRNAVGDTASRTFSTVVNLKSRNEKNWLNYKKNCSFMQIIEISIISCWAECGLVSVGEIVNKTANGFPECSHKILISGRWWIESCASWNRQMIT